MKKKEDIIKDGFLILTTSGMSKFPTISRFEIFKKLLMFSMKKKISKYVKII